MGVLLSACYISAQEGGGWCLEFQVTGMIKWGQKSNPKKFPWASNKPPKTSLDQKFLSECLSLKNFPERFVLYSENKAAGIPWIFRLFWKSLLTSSHTKKILSKFSSPKSPGIENLKPPKNHSIIPVTWNLEYPPKAPAGLSLIFGVGGDIQKIARDSSYCSEVNMLVLHQSSRGYTSKYEGKIPGPRPLMTALDQPKKLSKPS